MAFNIDLYISRDTDFTHVFTARDFNGSVINLTNYGVYAEYGGSPTDFSLPFSSVAITNPIAGEVTVKLSAYDSLVHLKPFLNYLFTVGVLTPSGARINICEGQINVRDTV